MLVLDVERAKDEIVDDVGKVLLPAGGVHLRVDGEAFAVGEEESYGPNVGVGGKVGTKQPNNPAKHGYGPLGIDMVPIS